MGLASVARLHALLWGVQFLAKHFSSPVRYPRHAVAPGCATKSWCVLPRKGSRTRTETPSREWWPMNDELLIRLRPRKSKHGPNENPRKYTGVLRSMLRLVQKSKRGQKIGGTRSAGGSGRAQRAFS